MASNRSRLERLYSGIYLLRLPTSYRVGDINCYLFVAMDRFDLIDPGCSSTRNLVLLVEALNQIGLLLSQARRIFLTHGHEDHGGLASEIARLSGATISLGAGDRQVFGTNVRTVFQANCDKVIARFRRLGLSEREVERLPAYFEARDYYKTPPGPAGELTDGEIVAAGETALTVVASPGHTQGSTCFQMEETGALFTGDTLIEHISPNPGASLYIDILFHDEVDYDPLGNFLGTLDKLDALDGKAAYAGHGKTILNPHDIINGYIGHHNKRLQQILDGLERRPMTCREAATLLFGATDRIEDAVLQVMEAHAHLIYLVRRGRVAESASDAGCRIYVRSR
jgi:glyoxylase-like metal-dependent hydrolase (beta-lactamase superfamily II)